MSNGALLAQITSPLEGEVDSALARWREGGKQQAPHLPLTPLPIPPPQGEKGKQAAMPRFFFATHG